MDKDTKNILDDSSSENVNGVITSDSFRTYLKLRGKRIRFNAKYFSLYLVISLLLLVSVLVFASTIKTAYFDSSDETKESLEKIGTIKTYYQKNDTIKVEPVNSALSGLFEIPVGMKIVELDFENPMTNGLKVNDIIVSIAGKDVKNITDFNSAVDELAEDTFISYTVYRNGVYQTVTPFDE